MRYVFIYTVICSSLVQGQEKVIDEVPPGRISAGRTFEYHSLRTQHFREYRVRNIPGAPALLVEWLYDKEKLFKGNIDRCPNGEEPIWNYSKIPIFGSHDKERTAFNYGTNTDELSHPATAIVPDEVDSKYSNRKLYTELNGRFASLDGKRSFRIHLILGSRITPPPNGFAANDEMGHVAFLRTQPDIAVRIRAKPSPEPNEITLCWDGVQGFQEGRQLAFVEELDDSLIGELVFGKSRVDIETLNAKKTNAALYYGGKVIAEIQPYIYVPSEK